VGSLLFLSLGGLAFGVYKYIAEYSRFGIWLARLSGAGFCYAAYVQYGLLPTISLSLLLIALALYFMGRFDMITWGIKGAAFTALAGAISGGIHSYIEFTRNPAPSIKEKYQWVNANGHILGEYLRPEYGGESCLLLVSPEIDRETLQHFRDGFRNGCVAGISLIPQSLDLNPPADDELANDQPFEHIYKQIALGVKSNSDIRLIITLVPIPFAVFEAFVPEDADSLPDDFPKWVFVSNSSDRIADLLANDIALALVAGKSGGRIRETKSRSAKSPHELFDAGYILITAENLDSMRGSHPNLFR
jgi:hypothetical protein